MIYLTQLIYVVPGEEEAFHAFEEVALAAIGRYHGTLLMRLRPGPSAFVEGEAEPPYEVHLVSFDTEASFRAYAADEARGKVLHLKERSVRSVLLIQGEMVSFSPSAQ